MTEKRPFLSRRARSLRLERFASRATIRRGGRPGPVEQTGGGLYHHAERHIFVQTVGLTLSYPADIAEMCWAVQRHSGDLGMYWFGPEDSNGAPMADAAWQVLSRVTIDTTRHTVAGISGHFSTFGLFAAGATIALRLASPSTHHHA